jgi:DNA-binding transcriptional MerR regulator
MGHRYYREEDIELFKSIKFLKEQGFQLRAIKMVLSDVRKIGQLDKKKMNMLKDELNAQVLCMDQTASEHVEKKEDSIMGQAFEAQKETMENEVCAASPEPVDTQSEPKVAQFKVIMNNIIMEALRENNLELSKAVSSNVSESVLKEMDYMMRMKEEREEERFKRLDDSIRSKQKARKERSATREKRKKKRMFHKKAE